MVYEVCTIFSTLHDTATLFAVYFPFLVSQYKISQLDSIQKKIFFKKRKKATKQVSWGSHNTIARAVNYVKQIQHNYNTIWIVQMKDLYHKTCSTDYWRKSCWRFGVLTTVLNITGDKKHSLLQIFTSYDCITTFPVKMLDLLT